MITNKKMNMITVGILGIVFMFTGSMANAALVSLVPDTPQSVIVNDPISFDVNGIDFTNGMSTGAVQVNWNPAFLSFSSATAGAGLIEFLELSTPGTGILDYSAGTFGSVGDNGAAFTFANLVFTGLAEGITNVGLADSPLGGPWFDGTLPDAIEITDVAYGAPVSVAVVNAVPVPGAVWLLGSGLIGLVGLKRRRKS